MQSALRMQTTVLPGKRIEVSAPELPEGCMVELIIVLPEPSLLPGGESIEAAPKSGKYPSALMQEYRSLIQKKLDRTFTEADATRLQAVRNEITEMDRQQPDTWDIQAQKLREELTQIRAEVEALPNA